MVVLLLKMETAITNENYTVVESEEGHIKSHGGKILLQNKQSKLHHFVFAFYALLILLLIVAGDLMWVVLNKSAMESLSLAYDDQGTMNDNPDVEDTPLNAAGDPKLWSQGGMESFSLAYNGQGSVDDNPDVEDTPAEGDPKLWSKEGTLFLIGEVQNAREEFDCHLKKNVWARIASKCSEKMQKHVSAKQAESKWKTLKRTYSSTLLHNKTSGKQRRYLKEVIISLL